MNKKPKKNPPKQPDKPVTESPKPSALDGWDLDSVMECPCVPVDSISVMSIGGTTRLALGVTISAQLGVRCQVIVVTDHHRFLELQKFISGIVVGG